ncbi:carbohydrate kinase family protein [Deinococcus yavapaiensis]|uniref:Fructokinase n=1 Tax=Deinococcus yavapaiensis KR-236 TaxID=694435 RepID=A0A318SG04_9DEIO|nr:carbohydrate kinase [Deinococcus yavapaiensis]PYE56314.1 fructokinase [Deinococcus yavapaiensis KR-236]
MSISSNLPIVVCAGEALADLVRTGERAWTHHPGGAIWNVARACATLGLPTGFAGAVGEDVFGDDLARATREARLDERFFQRAPRPTLLAVVHELHPPAYYFLGENAADLAFAASKLPNGWERAARWLHIGGVSLARAPLNEALLDMARLVKAAGGRVSFDPNARVSHRDPAYRPVFEAALRLADFVKFSDEDVRFFFPNRSEDEALLEVRAFTSAPIVVTRGGDGATLLHGAERREFDAVKVTVADTVGAGDAFVAGALFSETSRSERSWADHVAFALRVAATACTRSGAYAPTLAEVGAL